MKDIWVLYAFFTLMVFNLLGSLLYTFGLRHLRSTVRRATDEVRRSPRSPKDSAPVARFAPFLGSPQCSQPYFS